MLIDAMEIKSIAVCRKLLYLLINSTKSACGTRLHPAFPRNLPLDVKLNCVSHLFSRISEGALSEWVKHCTHDMIRL